jgi:RNA polymerase sigma factor (sigma-70 family)
MTDLELLQNYAGRGSEAAFRTLVERYLNLVHSVAMRHVQNPQLAEDVSQAVFILLARKAAGLKEGTVLGGWLFQTTRFVAARACRAERRRQQREQEANEMQLLSTPDQTWKRIAPALDEGLAQLGAADRNLVLLRFYEGKSHSEAGAALGLSEEAARKRGARALEKLRAWFTKRGTVLSATGLAAAMTANAVQAAPTELASGILAATAKASGAAALPELVRETLNAWRWLKLKLATACVIPGAAVVLIALAAQQPKKTTMPVTGKPNLVSSVGVSVTPQADAQAAVSKVENKASGNLRLHVVAKDSGEAIGRAMLALVGAPNWEQTYNFVTDDKGVCDIPLAADLERLVVGVLTPGWEARFVTWKPAQDDPVPAEYTLKVERVTNSIGGWLQDASGKGIENAQVWIQFGNGDYSARETPREQSGVLFPAPVATSDRDGRWSCAVIPNKESSFTLEARHPNFARTSIASSWPEPIEPKEEREKVRQLWAGTLITTLGQGLELQGRVTDEAGRPIAGARIEHKPSEEGGVSLRAGADGRFAFSKLNTGEFEIVASAEGFAPEVRKVQIGQQSAPLDIVLKPGALLRLRLVDKNETPVPGATVVLERWGDRSAPAHWRRSGASHSLRISLPG